MQLILQSDFLLPLYFPLSYIHFHFLPFLSPTSPSPSSPPLSPSPFYFILSCFISTFFFPALTFTFFPLSFPYTVSILPFPLLSVPSPSLTSIPPFSSPLCPSFTNPTCFFLLLVSFVFSTSFSHIQFLFFLQFSCFLVSSIGFFFLSLLFLICLLVLRFMSLSTSSSTF